MRQKAALAAILLQLTLSACSAWAAVDLSCVAGYRGYCRPGEWTPVTVTATTDGETISGRLVVDVLDPIRLLGRYVTSARIFPKPSSHIVYVSLPQALEAKIEVRFEARGRTLAKAEVGFIRPVGRATPILLNFTSPRAFRALDGRFMGVQHTAAGIGLAQSEAAISAAASPSYG